MAGPEVHRDWYTLHSTACLCSDAALSIPCCVTISVSILVGVSLSAVVSPLWEMGNDGTGSWSGETGAACIREGETAFYSPDCETECCLLHIKLVC